VFQFAFCVLLYLDFGHFWIAGRPSLL
jgi:hypothetical protein